VEEQDDLVSVTKFDGAPSKEEKTPVLETPLTLRVNKESQINSPVI